VHDRGLMFPFHLWRLLRTLVCTVISCSMWCPFQSVSC